VSNADPACPAIYALSQAGVIKGYDTAPPTFGPGDDVQRAQQAGFLVRALGWGGMPTGPRDFNDFDGLVQELQDASLILANACAVPADDTTCVARGYGDGRFGPTDPVSHAQAIELIARAFALDPTHAWAPAPPGCAAAGVPAVHAGAVCTYLANAGAIPDAPTTQAGWDAPASRAWVAMVLWQALLSAP
jgi:S-layer homology domain